MKEIIKNLEGRLVVTSRQVAEDFGKECKHVNEVIKKLIVENSTVKNMIIESTYLSTRGREEKEYLLTRDGFSLLVMGFTGSKALEWKLKYIEAFNKMEQTIKGQAFNTDQLSPELQMFNKMFQAIAKSEIEQKQIKEEIKEAKNEIQGIRDAVTLDVNGWRKETTELINKIANKIGGFEHIRNVREESYKLLNETYGVDVSRRLQNKKKNMSYEGVSKSKINKVNVLDVIAEDKKLLNGYINIVAKMAIKNKVA